MQPLLAGVGLNGLAEHQRLALWTLLKAQRISNPFPRLCRTCSFEKYPHQDLHLEPQPLEAAHASLLHLAGM